MADQRFDTPSTLDHYATIAYDDSTYDLVPGPVYFLYLDPKLEVDRGKSPSLSRFLKLVKRTDIEEIYLHGKELCDPDFLEWRYSCMVSYERRVKRFAGRSARAMCDREMQRVVSEGERRLKRIEKVYSESGYERAREKLVARYGERDIEGLSGEKRTDRITRKFIRLEDQRGQLEVDRSLLEKRLADYRARFQRMLDAERVALDNRLAVVEQVNAPYLEMFSEEEKEEFRYFRPRDVRRLFRAKNRGATSSTVWKDYYYQACNPLVRNLYPLVAGGIRRAIKRTNRWYYTKLDIPLLSRHRPTTFQALNNFKAGILGNETQMKLVNPNRRIGENLTKVIMVVDSCSSTEARKRALSLLSDLDIPDPEGLMDTYIGQYINDDYHYKILLAYTLAFRPEILVIDRMTLKTRRPLTQELYALIRKLQPAYRFVLLIIDDNAFDKTFADMVVFRVDREGKIHLDEKGIG